jgi:hypothetical protein
MLHAGEECCVLGFAGGCYDTRDNGGDGGDDTVDARGLIYVAEEEYAADDGASVRSGQVRGVDVYDEDHAACMECGRHVGSSSAVAKGPIGGVHNG